MSKNKCDTIVTMFNSLTLKISTYLLNLFPENRDFSIYNNALKDLIAKKPLEPISVFLVNVYANDKYRQSILNSDEQFFKSENHNNLTSSNEDRIRAMFQFKEYWDKLSNDSKLFIKEAMKQLVNMCETYVVLKTR